MLWSCVGICCISCISCISCIYVWRSSTRQGLSWTTEWSLSEIHPVPKRTAEMNFPLPWSTEWLSPLTNSPSSKELQRWIFLCGFLTAQDRSVQLRQPDICVLVVHFHKESRRDRRKTSCTSRRSQVVYEKTLIEPLVRWITIGITMNYYLIGQTCKEKSSCG